MKTTLRHLRKTAIGTGFEVFRATGLHRVAAPLTRGSGVILMFHHVRPWTGDGFAPNRGLEITPDYFETVLLTLCDRGFEIIGLDAAIARLEEEPEEPGRPFAVITFDDGYRDTLEFALPILRRHAAPFSLFVTTGFADRTARLWWVELEEAVRRLPSIAVEIDGAAVDLPSRTTAQKTAAFEQLYARLRGGSEATLLDVIARLGAAAGLDPRAAVDRLC